MPVIRTDELVEGQRTPQQEQIYNGLDCCVTFEVHEALQTLFNVEPEVYGFERALQGPALEMSMRGFRIDETERRIGAAALRRKLVRLDNVLQQLAFAVWGKGLNPRSPKQLIDFFYGTMHLPEQWSSKKGVRRLSTDRETLEKLQIYFHALPIITTILAVRDYAKQLEVLETEIDPDGRFRTSFNIAGTETWRFSSSGSVTGTGRNIQNIAPELRKMFVADPGYILVGIDLEQAESREVGWLCGTILGDWTYLDACYSGDLHVTTAKLIWRDLGWTGDPKRDRALADVKFYREFSYRDLAKRGGHGSNYMGTPWTMARHLKVVLRLMEDFQRAYFTAYPAIPKWHRWVATQIQTTHQLTTPWEVTRTFFGRPSDDTTLREAIAFSPQSSTAMRMNLGMWRVWNEMGSDVQLLAQVHDAIYFQVPITSDIPAICSRALSLIDIRHSHGGRELVVPGECKVGFNWAAHHVHDEKCQPGCTLTVNPNGLRKGTALRPRLEGLDRVF